MGRVIESAWRDMAPKKEQNEKKPKRLKENMISKPQGWLQNKLGKLRDRKNKALRDVQNMNTARKLGPHTQTDRGMCPGVGI
jgi:hypothetical protein